MGDKSSGYWEACFQLREPCPKFLQPMVDKVSTVELHAYLALEVRRLMFRDAFLVVVYLVHHNRSCHGGGGMGKMRLIHVWKTKAVLEMRLHLQKAVDELQNKIYT